MTRLDSLEQLDGMVRAAPEANEVLQFALKEQSRLAEMIKPDHSMAKLLRSPIAESLAMHEMQISGMWRAMDNLESLNHMSGVGVAQARVEARKVMRITSMDPSIAGALGGSAAESLLSFAKKNSDMQSFIDSMNGPAREAIEAAHATISIPKVDRLFPAQNHIDSMSSFSGPNHIKLPPLPCFPPNPIHETNRTLGVLSEKTEEINLLLNNSTNEARKDGQETRWQNKRSNWFAAINLALLILTAGWTFWVQSSDIKLRDLRASIEDNAETNTKRLLEINRANGIMFNEMKAKILDLENQIKQQKEVGKLLPPESKE